MLTRFRLLSLFLACLLCLPVCAVPSMAASVDPLVPTVGRLDVSWSIAPSVDFVSPPESLPYPGFSTSTSLPGTSGGQYASYNNLGNYLLHSWSAAVFKVPDNCCAFSDFRFATPLSLSPGQSATFSIDAISSTINLFYIPTPLTEDDALFAGSVPSGSRDFGFLISIQGELIRVPVSTLSSSTSSVNQAYLDPSNYPNGCVLLGVYVRSYYPSTSLGISPPSPPSAGINLLMRMGFTYRNPSLTLGDASSPSYPPVIDDIGSGVSGIKGDTGGILDILGQIWDIITSPIQWLISLLIPSLDDLSSLLTEITTDWAGRGNLLTDFLSIFVSLFNTVVAALDVDPNLTLTFPGFSYDFGGGPLQILPPVNVAEAYSSAQPVLNILQPVLTVVFSLLAIMGVYRLFKNFAFIWFNTPNFRDSGFAGMREFLKSYFKYIINPIAWLSGSDSAAENDFDD